MAFLTVVLPVLFSDVGWKLLSKLGSKQAATANLQTTDVWDDKHRMPGNRLYRLHCQVYFIPNKIALSNTIQDMLLQSPFSSTPYFLGIIFTSNEKDEKKKNQMKRMAGNCRRSYREYGIFLQARLKPILVTTQQGINKTIITSETICDNGRHSLTRTKKGSIIMSTSVLLWSAFFFLSFWLFSLWRSPNSLGHVSLSFSSFPQINLSLKNCFFPPQKFPYTQCILGSTLIQS